MLHTKKWQFLTFTGRPQCWNTGDFYLLYLNIYALQNWASLMAQNYCLLLWGKNVKSSCNRFSGQEGREAVIEVLLVIKFKKKKKERKKKGTLLTMACDNKKTFQVLLQENYNPVSTVLLHGYNISRHLGIICSYDFSTPF